LEVADEGILGVHEEDVVNRIVIVDVNEYPGVGGGGGGRVWE
jgi:hypothetical protein